MALAKPVAASMPVAIFPATMVSSTILASPRFRAKPRVSLAARSTEKENADGILTSRQGYHPGACDQKHDSRSEIRTPMRSTAASTSLSATCTYLKVMVDLL